MDNLFGAISFFLAWNKHCLLSEQVDENQSKTIEFSEFLTLMASETWNEIERGEIVKVRLFIGIQNISSVCLSVFRTFHSFVCSR